MSFKCAVCANSQNVVAYVVDTKQIMCRNCVGRLHFPGTKQADYNIEELDKQHPFVQSVTTFVMHASVVAGLGLALWHSGVGDGYFKGASTCPALSVGRQALARFDANVFYYYKSSLATYCDIEDSFWRLLMDGWARGVVSGSDSLLLLFSTLPKAFLFKSVVTTFLRPVYAVLYAVCGLVLSSIIVRFEDAAQWVINHVPFLGTGNAAGGRLSGYFKKLWRLPTELKLKLTTKNTILDKAGRVFFAVGVSDSLRLLAHAAGFHHLAALGTAEVSTWQLAFEPLCFFYLSRLCSLANAKLDKTLWKKGAATVAAPLTLWRKKPMTDVVELLAYCRNRIQRSYDYYKKQAEDILHILVDDIFNVIVVLRLLGIFFHLAPAARSLARSTGFGGVIQRHSEWFQEATGFVETDAGAKYLSDRLLKFGFGEVLMGLKVITGAVEDEALGALQHLDQAKQAVWRLVVPVLFYLLLTKWTGLLAKQNRAFKAAWKGTDWTDGAYAEMLQGYGSFWNRVEAKEAWEPPAKVYPSAAK